MMPRCTLFLAVALTACPAPPRVQLASAPPSQCTESPCGQTLAVTTTLARGDALTEAECQALCASSWCSGRSIGPAPGCELLSSTELYCSAVAYDCGYTFPTYCGPDVCSGCCRFDGSCTMDYGTGDGRKCWEWPRDERCSTHCGAVTACGGRLDAMPRWSTCDGVDGGFVAPTSATLDCIDACSASDAGMIVECGGTLSSCDDAGFSFTTACAPDAGLPSTCATGCADARAQCEAACPLTSSAECASCAKECGLRYGRCLVACP